MRGSVLRFLRLRIVRALDNECPDRLGLFIVYVLRKEPHPPILPRAIQNNVVPAVVSEKLAVAQIRIEAATDRIDAVTHDAVASVKIFTFLDGCGTRSRLRRIEDLHFFRRRGW